MPHSHFIRLSNFLLFGTAAILITSCMESTSQNKPENWPQITPPIADKIPHQRIIHDDTVADDYYWMIDYFKKGKESDRVIAYLEAENKYTKEMMEATETLQEKLFNEMKSRVKEKDESVPIFNNGYYYYRRTEDGKQYYKYCRKKGSLDAEEEILLDIDQMAESYSYYAATGFSISSDNNLLAFAIDTVSRRQYQVFIKDLSSGEIIDDGIVGTSGNVVWANDNQTIFYTKNNASTLLTEKIMRHQIGQNAVKDVSVYTEKDNTNYLWVQKSKSKEYILITSQATTSSEIRYIEANNPTASFKIFQERVPNILYSVIPLENNFLIRTNKDAVNFKLMQCSKDSTNINAWTDLIPHKENVLIEDVDEFKNYLVISERENGLSQLAVFDRNSLESYRIDFNEPVYTVYTTANFEYERDKLCYAYSSMVRPGTVYEYDLTTRKQIVIKQEEVGGGYNRNNYITQRIYVTVRDGEKVPVSLVYKNDFQKNGTSPLLLYAYGSYGHSIDPNFNRNIISLLDRGFVYAIAHIRGGEEMGRAWYENGKLMNKKNTFYDFIDVGKFLVDNHYASRNKLYAMGGSAGGLLMGAVANMAPDLWNGIVAQVPFVDVVNTMLDESIPLTTNEYEEWGNPNNKESYEYMKSYSPYENIKPKNYPNMLITTGLHDSQVQYFEPAKWVAKLRTKNTGNNVILFKTNMEYGHGGASGRFDYLKEKALEYAFLLKLEEINQ